MTEDVRRPWATEVARYYEGNTGRFLLAGRGRGVHALHRELWGPGVASTSAAADYVNRVVAGEIADLASGPDPVIVDFGCGVGGTLFHLARRFTGARLTGVTVSRRQVEIGRRLARRVGCAERCSFALGDFHTVELGFRADAVVAVESFVHSDGVDDFLDNACRHLRSAGRLIVVDDFLAFDEHALDDGQRRRVGQLRAGWRAPAVCSADSLARAAAPHGLEMERSVDLTPLTRPGARLRDRAVALVGPGLDRLGLARLPICGSIIGGHAVQVGLREGFLQYRLAVFRRIA